MFSPVGPCTLEKQKRHRRCIHAEELTEISRPLSFFHHYRHTPARSPMQTYAFLIRGIISTGLTSVEEHMASGWPRKNGKREAMLFPETHRKFSDCSKTSSFLLTEPCYSQFRELQAIGIKYSDGGEVYLLL